MLRKRGRKMTQAELGEAVGFTPAVIGFYGSETNEPSYDTWVAMARALMTTPGELMFGLPIEADAEPLGAATTQKRQKGARG